MNRKKRRASRKTAAEDVSSLFAGAAQYHQQGRLAEAAQLYRQVLALSPRHADSQHRLGVIAYQQGRHQMAVEMLKAAIAQNPGVATYHSHLGLALEALGQPEEAVAACRTAVGLEVQRSDLHNNLGVMLARLGRREEAAACYHDAIARDPRLADVHHNLGNVLMELGRPKDAQACYRQLVALTPAFAEGHANLACALLAEGDASAALHAIMKALALEETPEAKKIFVQCVKDFDPTREAGALRPLLLRALTEGWDRPEDLVRASTGLVRHHPALASLAVGWKEETRPEEFLAALAGDALLQVLLCLTPNQDIVLETLLTLARRRMLQSVLQEDDTPLDFFSALARQCFLNEYVFAQTDAEVLQAEGLRARLASALEEGAVISPLWIAAVAAYFPLHGVPGTGGLLERSWPDAIEALLTQQLREPEVERELGLTIPRLSGIENAVSRAVRAQYEENPYPRWVQLGAATAPEDLTSYLRRSFPFAAIAPAGLGERLDILVAGCGTGRNALETAQKFRGARTLGIDLSLASLAHAARKSRGLADIEFAQADLLELGALARRFDLIEAVGVLHHLEDPFAGWGTLLSLLKPQGVMMVGLYSAPARRHLPALGDRLTGRPAADLIRQARQDLLRDQPDLALHQDFFTTSTCRDLLFHSCQHTLSLEAIGDFLQRHDLRLLGFVLDDAVLAAYRLRYPDDPAAVHLGHWQEFEAENPDTFSDMYQFWLQKGA